MTLPTAEGLHDRLRDALATHGVPGAVVGLDVRGERVAAAAGTANAASGLAVARDTLFQIGSVTKVYTATAVLRLVDEGRLALDDTLAERVPELRLADPATATRITIAHLLTHAAGLEADHFAGPRGAHPVAEFVADLDGWPQLHEPGAFSSYCNVGWVVLGRIVELVTGQEFHAALRSLVLEPAGLDDTLADPEQLLLRPVAVGHAPGPDGPVVVPPWRLDPGAAPAGTTLCATIDDLLAFGRLPLDGGAAADGTRVLNAELTGAMQERYLPRHGVLGDAHAGYGWGVYTWDGTTVLAHDGATAAHFSTLVVIPEHDAVVGVLTNGVGGMSMHATLVRELVRDVFGIERPSLPRAVDGSDQDLSRYSGTYRRSGVETAIRVDGDHLAADIVATLAPGQPPIELSVPVRPAGERFVHGPLPPLGEGPVDFVEDDDGIMWLFTIGRASRRVG